MRNTELKYNIYSRTAKTHWRVSVTDITIYAYQTQTMLIIVIQRHPQAYWYKLLPLLSGNYGKERNFFQASVAVRMRFSFFLDVTLSRLLLIYRLF